MRRPTANEEAKAEVISENPTTMAEAVALFKHLLQEGKKTVPIKDASLPGTGLTQQAAQRTLAALYSQQEKAAMDTANKAVLAKFEFVVEASVVPEFVEPSTISELIALSPDDSWDNMLITINSICSKKDGFANGNNSGREAAMASCPTGKTASGKIKIDLRFADLSRADLRLLALPGANLRGATLTCVRMPNETIPTQ